MENIVCQIVQIVLSVSVKEEATYMKKIPGSAAFCLEMLVLGGSSLAHMRLQQVSEGSVL